MQSARFKMYCRIYCPQYKDGMSVGTRYLSTFFLSISHVYSCLSLYNFLPHLLFLYFQLLTHSINPSGKHQVFKIIFPNISLESVTSFLFLQLPLYSPFLSLCLLLFLSFHFHFHSSFLLSCQNETCHTCFLFFRERYGG
uniref:Uncharacterized protein n=1 Tax=Cacopsylla melanoneura TaxID=428564 RepID=A0A8D9E829_9HEMI